MATTEILPFATGGGANVVSQAVYAALASTGAGYSAGVASSNQVNKTLRQAAFMAAGLANFMVAQGISVPDDGNLTNLVAEITAGFLAFINAQAINQAGECRLSVTSTTAIKLAPFGGNRITIDGVAQSIPAAGVSISNGGLAASTSYYVYVFMNAGVMALELSATGHSTDIVTAGNIGVEIKTGDPTRTLVGLIRTDAANHYQTVAAGGIINWFNRCNIALKASVSGVTFTGNVSAEITTTLRVLFLTWADDAPIATVDAALSNSATGGSMTITASFDTAQDGSSINITEWSATNGVSAAASNSGQGLSEGFHYHTLYGNSGGITTSTLANCYNRVSVRG